MKIILSNSFHFFIVLLVIAACVPAKKEDLTDIELNLTDTTFQKIVSLQDAQKADSLIKWFEHPDATYRFLAVRAFGSIKAHSHHSYLVRLLKDPVVEVRSAAAYALGQSGEINMTDSLITAFDSADSLRQNETYNAQVLEAIGKLGDRTTLTNIATVSTYLPSDTTLLEGQAWSIYRFALRGIISPEGTDRMIELIKGNLYPHSVRKIAANYLMRAGNIDLKAHSAVLISSFKSEPDANIKMCLAIALGKCNTDTARRTLVGELADEKDYRVRCNILRGLRSYNLSSHLEAVQSALSDRSVAVAQIAANVFYENGDTEDANDYKKWARDTSYHWSVRIKLYQAAQRHFPFYYSISKGAINWDITKWLNKEKDPYIIGALVQAVAEDPKNYVKVLGFLDHEHPFVATSAASSLKHILDHSEFDVVHAIGKNLLQRRVNDKVKEKMKAGDPGLIAELTNVLNHKNLRTTNGNPDYQYLDTVLLKLNLPEHIETYNMLNKAIATIKDTKTPEDQNPLPNHPIDWKLLSKVSDSSSATIETAKGDIVFQFKPLTSPGTVANFIDLAERKFFDGKNFHRVVPNFVVQGGCTRGDGYGSLNYTIRSELPIGIRYDQEGLVGMASAGNHTECSQWFITHCPTPHLDGNYTIFAEVKKGMDVMHSLEQGDVIQSVAINY